MYGSPRCVRQRCGFPSQISQPMRRMVAQTAEASRRTVCQGWLVEHVRVTEDFIQRVHHCALRRISRAGDDRHPGCLTRAFADDLADACSQVPCICEQIRQPTIICLITSLIASHKSQHHWPHRRRHYTWRRLSAPTDGFASGTRSAKATNN